MPAAAVWAAIIIGLFFVVIALDNMGFFSSRNHFPVDGRTVVITGGSQGMGRGLGRLLAQKGANVVLVARNQEKLDKAKEYVASAAKDPSRQRFHTISADVTLPEENTRLLDEVTTWNGGNPPDIVWANAGSSQPMLYLDASIDTLRSQMDINYWAAAYLSHATLALWTKPQTQQKSNTTSTSPSNLPRHFIITSSSLCFVGLAGYATYAPAKAALRSLADSLRSELNLYNGARHHDASSAPPTDIQIHLVAPGTITSPGLEQEEKTKHPVTRILEEGDPKQTEDEVALAAVRALEKGYYLITTQFLGAAMRASSLNGSPRNNWFVDTVFSWITSVVWLFVGPDMEGKVFKYGKVNGVKAV